MAPKKQTIKERNADADDSTAKNATEYQDNSAKKEDSKPKQQKKRAAADQDDAPPAKEPRRSGRGSSKLSTPKLLNFLLSKEAEDLTRPDDEAEDIKDRGQIKTYSASVMNPFEELMCAVILSRPISHRLGLRTIRTVLNDPYNWTSAKTVQDAGHDKQHQAFWDARTQHKDKSASYIGSLADVVLDKFAKGDGKGEQLATVVDECNDDVGKARELLKSSIKGLGPTGLDIFFRRVQWLWESVYPFIDGRTSDSLRKFNLPYDAESLQNAVDEHWKELDVKHLAGNGDAQKQRRAFVVILERAIGADLEGKVETVISHAST